MRALWKFVGQVAAAIAYVALFGPLSFAPAPFVGDIPLGLFAAPITVFWIVGFMNAFNFMDGVNGIAAACAGFVLFAVAVAGANLDVGFWAMSAGVAAAALVGFLPQIFLAGASSWATMAARLSASFLRRRRSARRTLLTAR
ncbi:MAG: hypothetical protein LRY51_09315 [Geovibrio sp.]|nr:hypothetical protein [Geovibrio sp.]